MYDMSRKNAVKLVYPDGVKEITEDLGTDELVRRLKTCAQAFQSMGQDDNNSDYLALAMHLAQETFLEHTSKDVRLLIACCIADVFRVYAPDAPYKEPEHLKMIFLFLIKQLRGLEDPKDPAFKRYFYLLENLAWVKSFNICIELEDNQEILCELFSLFFSIINDDHSKKVRNFMLDVMAPLISEADSVSQKLLDIILKNIIEPKKSQERNAYELARDLLIKTSASIEPYIQAFFNNCLILGKAAESEVGKSLYDIIYELNAISPSTLLSVLPQLEIKLKSNDEKERLDVTRLLARMFSDKDSDLATQHRALWNCFLGRFNDISMTVRTRCVQYSMHFILNHPELHSDITEQLKLRQHDPEETVRYEVVMAIVSAAKKDMNIITNDLLNFVKERTLDKKFKIRKEALLGLSMIYKKCMGNVEISEEKLNCISWIKDKVLHVYYQTALEDRLLVERILHTCLVPYQLPPEERIKKLYQLYATVDDYAVKALNELLKCQHTVRGHVKTIVDLHSQPPSEERDKQMNQKIVIIAKSLPEPVKAQEFLKKFNAMLHQDAHLKTNMQNLMDPGVSCQDAEMNVREVLKKLGNPVMRNIFYMTIKQLLERVAPVMVDRLSIQYLLQYVELVLQGDVETIQEIGSNKADERGLKLLLSLSAVFPGAFQLSEIFEKLVCLLSTRDEKTVELTIKILKNVGRNIEAENPDVAEKLLSLLREFIKMGTAKQAKYAVQCLNILSEGKEELFADILADLQNDLHIDAPNFCTALVSIGHIANVCPSNSFQAQLKSIVSKVVVKELLMEDREHKKDSREWCSEENLSDETRAKLEGLKLMVRWLLGLRSSLARGSAAPSNSGSSTLRLLTTVVRHDGDLMDRGSISKSEMAWLRLTAGCCILKIAQEPFYAEIVQPDQFHVVSRLLLDNTKAVREHFAQKLHKGLINMKLPLEFMSMFALGSREINHELKPQIKQYIQANVNKRRDYIKQQQNLAGEKLLQYLPDYILPFAVHMLAHDPDFKKFDNVKSLQMMKESLWLLLEPLILRNENYSFGFFKNLLDNMKQTKDAVNTGDEMQNLKLYAICDLALGLVLGKTSNYVLKEFPVEPILPKKLFTEVDKNFNNTKMYLPPEMAFTAPKKSGIELDIAYKSKKSTSTGARVETATSATETEEAVAAVLAATEVPVVEESNGTQETVSSNDVNEETRPTRMKQQTIKSYITSEKEKANDTIEEISASLDSNIEESKVEVEKQVTRSLRVSTRSTPAAAAVEDTPSTQGEDSTPSSTPQDTPRRTRKQTLQTTKEVVEPQPPPPQVETRRNKRATRSQDEEDQPAPKKPDTRKKK